MKDSSAKSNGGAVKKVAAKRPVNKNIAKRAASKKALGPRIKAERAAKAAAAEMGGGRGGKRMSANRLNP